MSLISFQSQFSSILLNLSQRTTSENEPKSIGVEFFFLSLSVCVCVCVRDLYECKEYAFLAFRQNKVKLFSTAITTRTATADFSMGDKKKGKDSQ